MSRNIMTTTPLDTMPPTADQAGTSDGDYRFVAMLPTAITLATTAQGSRTDENGELLLMRTLRKVVRLKACYQQEAVALFDAMRAGTTLAEIREAGLRASRHGFTIDILNALSVLERRQWEPQDDYLARVAKDDIATIVLRADLHESMDVTRIVDLGRTHTKRLQDDHRAMRELDHLNAVHHLGSSDGSEQN